MGSRKRGADAVAAIRATVAGIDADVVLDEAEEHLLAAISRAYNRAADLDRDAAKARASGGSPRRVTELAAEARLQEAQAAKWTTEIVRAVQETVAPTTKSWSHQKAARARWDGVASGQGGR